MENCEKQAILRRLSWTINDNGCWIPNREPIATGFVRLTVNGKKKRVHHLSYEMFKGPLEENQRVIQTCGDRRCMNPEHLEAGAVCSPRSAEHSVLCFEVDRDTGCWNVVGRKPVCGTGYYVIGHKGKSIGAHRYSYILHKGPIPEGYYICHHCDNPGCVNPDHLFAGTPQDNMNDMVAKDRWRWGRKGGRQKLTKEQIIEIRNSTVSSYKLAEVYGVSSTQIRRIRNGSRCSSI
jgi:hypothetical protein